MKLYAVCPTFGHKLLRGDNGTSAEVLCPKCSNKIIIVGENSQIKAVKKSSYEL